MKVGVLPVDSSHPNYALMKVSNYWKSQGAEVEFYTPFAHYDLVYASKIFTFTPDYPHPIFNADDVVRGGTGYDISSRLSAEIEGSSPDYDLYFVDKRFALGFLTRGCPNNCPWCVVAEQAEEEGGRLEVAYSGGKDSDLLLFLTRQTLAGKEVKGRVADNSLQSLRE